MLVSEFKIHGVILIMSGTLMCAYHADLWILDSTEKHKH